MLVTCAVGVPLAAAACEPSGKRLAAAVIVASDEPLAGAKIMIDYPEAKLALPGARDDASVRTRLRALPSGFDAVSNDFDHALRIVLASGTATIPARAFTVEFDVCKGAAPIAPAELSCTVEQAAAPTGELVAGARCSVELK